MAITNMLPSIWSARILAKLEKDLVFGQPGVVNRDYEGDIRADGDRVHIHSFNDLTVSSYTKNSTTISYEQLTDTRVTLLIDQSKYFAFKVDDIDTAQMRPEIIDAAADRAAYQLAEDADSYIAGLYSGASTSAPDNTVETSQFTSTNVYQKLVDLSVLMDQVNLPAGGRFIVVPPWVKGLLLQNSSFVTAAKPDAVLNGEIGQIAGIRILVSNNVKTTGTSPVVSHMMAGHPSALAYAEQIVNVEGLRLEGSFADAVRGLHLYGAKVLDGARLFDLQANP
jgi:N4-gp56 family major capsid protein